MNSIMFIELPDGLSIYLLPLLIAVPLALLVYFISRRQEPEEQLPPPAPVPAPTPVAAAAPAPTAAVEPAAVLLVDDSAVARAKLGRLFDGAGYRTTLARDGVEALERLAEQRFQVMVTDLEMPNKDGFELIAAVQGAMETEDLPIIAITGHDELQARVHQIQGVYGIFKKPWNDRELLKRVEALAHLRH
ncbi:response regulator [Roseateles violae]|uniref:Response regulator n=1 Tax=Roseateles violae TaxID=3058042 RepID=A0ABT8DTH3_9BURK|nr:response regulator [Pelomonas sp. PFR6]MDN3919471.1 response regulator [Pelomonas sp. PFR6]